MRTEHGPVQDTTSVDQSSNDGPAHVQSTSEELEYDFMFNDSVYTVM